jgi:hypothetical protein
MSETAPYLTVTSGFSGPEIWEKIELGLKAVTCEKHQENILRLFNDIIMCRLYDNPPTILPSSIVTLAKNMGKKREK